MSSLGLLPRSTTILFTILTIWPEGKARAQLDPLRLYDDFTASKISPDKWLGGEGGDSLGLEARRGISNGQLQLTTRSVGFTLSDTGVGTNFVSLAHPDPEQVTEMKATITATAVSVKGCASNSTNATQAFAGLAGNFFNTARASNDEQTNDVIAAIGLSRDSALLPLSVLFSVVRCTDSHCGTSELFASDVLGGAVPIGTAVSVEIQFDRSNHQFIFTRGAISKPVLYGSDFSDVSSPGLPFKGLEVFNNVANCTTLPRPLANISALFDDVSRNSSAVGP